MFADILNFELRYWLKSRSFYFYLSSFFLIALLSMAAASGALEEGSSSLNSIANSPLSIYRFVNLFNKILLFLLPAIAGASLYRDFKSNFHSILYSYPFSRVSYLTGKFTGSFIVICMIALSAVLGLALGTFVPAAGSVRLLSFDPVPYLQVYFIFLVPNLLIFGVITFSAVFFTRNIYAGFISVILLLLIKEVFIRLAGPEGIAALLADPFGENIMQSLTRYLTIHEQNSIPLPLTSSLFFNRLIWLSVSALLFSAVCLRFSMRNNESGWYPGSGKREIIREDSPATLTGSDLLKPGLNFSLSDHIRISWKLSQTDFLYILRSGVFMSAAVAGVLLAYAVLVRMNPQTGTLILPLTWVVLGLPVFFFSFLIQILTFLYAGILVHRAKRSRFFDLISVTAVPDWVLLFSKFLALVKMQILLLLLIMVTGIAVQVYKGHYSFEIGHYLFDLFGIHLIGFAVWAFVSLMVQTVFTRNYVGLFVLILMALAVMQLPSLGIESGTVRLNDSPGSGFYLNYSDIHGHDHLITAYFVYEFYWLLFGMLAFCIILLLWQRELTGSFAERIRIAGRRFKGGLAIAVVILSAGITVCAYYLRQQEESPENIRLSESDRSVLLAKFEEKFGKYENVIQPRIVSVFVNLDLYPETSSFTARGDYVLVNKSARPIDTLLIRTGFDEITDLNFHGEYTLIDEDTLMKFSVYKLEKGIAPNDSIKLSFSVRSHENTLLARRSNVLENGTYIRSDIFPRLGYFANTEIPNPDDSASHLNHYQSRDADLIEFEAILSTVPEQTAITTGSLIREWKEGNRKYFHYKTDKPVKFVLGFNSAKFGVLKEDHKGTDLRIYYHPGHTYSLNRMMEGLKLSLDYNSSNFGAYQHSQAHIIEFPRSEGSYATTAGNCIQISEMRFITDTNITMDGGIDLSFYVPAHELAHQWWGNQVIPANALGATMITESIAEYISAKVYEKRFGKAGALQFLKIQRDRYLSGRAEAEEQEAPLYLVNPEQTYISYGKGAIAFYTLSEFIGEQALNNALRDYLHDVRYAQPPYTTSPELLGYLRGATPDSLKYLITDMFMTPGKEKILAHFDKILLQASPGD